MIWRAFALYFIVIGWHSHVKSAKHKQNNSSLACLEDFPDFFHGSTYAIYSGTIYSVCVALSKYGTIDVWDGCVI